MICPNPDCPDRVATGEPGEYRAGVTHCPYCGEPLVDRLPEDPDHWPTAEISAADAEPEAVLETSDAAELEIVKSILLGAEIPFMVRGHEQFKAFRGGHAAFRFNPGAGRLVVEVPADRAEEARALLTEAEPDE